MQPIDNNATRSISIATDPSDTVNLPTIRTASDKLKRFTLPIIVVAMIVVFAIGGITGYAFGSNKAVNNIGHHGGWLLTTATVQGGVTPFTTDTVYIAWDTTQTPHDLQSHWYIFNPAHTKQQPLVTDIKINVASNGQGGITITAHEATGDIPFTGTLVGNVLTMTIPPNSGLFPAAPLAYVTLTFAPSTNNAYNSLVASGGL